MSDEEIRRQLVGYSYRFKNVVVPSAEVIRRRLRRRRIKLAVVTGSSAVMLAAGTVAAGAALPSAWRLTGPANARHHATVSPLGWVPAGPELPANATPEAAPYYVSLGLVHHGYGLRASVHDWRTGAFLGQVRPPAGPAGGPVGGRCFHQVVGASDDRTFLLAVQGCRLYIRTWFYELRLTPSGHPEPLIPISLPVLLKYDGTFALSPDGTHLAYGDVLSWTQPKSTVTVYDLMTGTQRTWSGPGLVGGPVWMGDRTLAVALGWNSRTTPPPVPMGWRMLDTAAPGSSLTASRVLTGLNNVDPVPAGRNVIYSPRILFGTEITQDELARYSARTGRREFAFKPWLLVGRNYTWCDPLWTDGSGAHALALCGSGPNFGLRLDGNRMRLIRVHFLPVQYLQPSGDRYTFAF
jgi:hypothetical protein